MIWNWLRRHPLLADIGLVAVLLLATIAAASRHAHASVGIGLGVAETLPLLWRRRAPIAVAAMVTAMAVGMIALGVWLLPFQVAIALYTVAATAERRLAVVSGIVSIIAVAVAEVATPPVRFGDVTWRVVFLSAAWLLGDSIGSRRAYVSEIEAKAERLEREHEAEARRAAAEEQSRIAREIHDVVAHSLSVIVIQAAAADDALEDESSAVREPVRAIETAARSALGDLRRVLGVLRDEAAEYEPQPALAQLDPLVERVRGTGLPVEFEIEGESRQLPAAVELSAYRIVQEALTNTLKHAEATHAHVRVRYGEALELEIHDDGRGPSNGAIAGNGLIGMRERAAMLGGELSAAPAPGGGFVVHARIPIEPA